MQATPRRLRLPVPCSILTGALAAGKTTAIASLLQTRPQDELWAVLVNEFGAAGLDAAFLAAPSKAGGIESGGVHIHQLAGGCLCCSLSNVTPLTIAQLLRRVKPDRLLIEPSGLAHPAALLSMLRNGHLSSALELGPVICLVDASKFRAGSLPAPPASLSSHLLADQISVADILVGSKADCCDDATLDAFHAWARGLRPAKLLITTARHGRIDCAAASTLLSWPVHASSGSTLQPVVSAQQAPQQLEPQQGLPVQRLRRETSRPAVPWLSSAGVDESRQADLDGCSSGTAMAHHGSDQPHNQWFERKEVQDSSGEHLACGWIFAPRCQFDEQRLLALLQELAPACLRLKGVFRVSAACFKAASAASTPGAPPAAASCQQAACAVELQEIAYQHDSRLEVILSTATAQQPAAVGHTMGVQDGSAVLASSGDMPGTWRQQVASGLVAAAGRDWHLLELLLLSTLQAAD